MQPIRVEIWQPGVDRAIRWAAGLGRHDRPDRASSAAALVRAYSPERYFDYRRGPQSLTLTGKAGQIFQKMINYINGLESTVLAVGDINSDTNRMEETSTRWC
jgi:hypothetical protein